MVAHSKCFDVKLYLTTQLHGFPNKYRQVQTSTDQTHTLELRQSPEYRDKHQCQQKEVEL